MIVIMVPIAVAPCPSVFQVTTLALCLAAVFPMLALRIMQLAFGITDLLLASFVIVAGNGPYRNRSAQE
jgi:hypothetical protein